jgi:hypothetical protein
LDINLEPLYQTIGYTCWILGCVFFVVCEGFCDQCTIFSYIDRRMKIMENCKIQIFSNLYIKIINHLVLKTYKKRVTDFSWMTHYRKCVNDLVSEMISKEYVSYVIGSIYEVWISISEEEMKISILLRARGEITGLLLESWSFVSFSWILFY